VGRPNAVPRVTHVLALGRASHRALARRTGAVSQKEHRRAQFRCSDRVSQTAPCVRRPAGYPTQTRVGRIRPVTVYRIVFLRTAQSLQFLRLSTKVTCQWLVPVVRSAPHAHPHVQRCRRTSLSRRQTRGRQRNGSTSEHTHGSKDPSAAMHCPCVRGRHRTPGGRALCPSTYRCVDRVN
jgi:hypothetical protein